MTTVLAGPVLPLEGESYEEFVVRAHSELLDSITDPAERNQAVWSAWEETVGDAERNRARQFFPPEKFRLVPNVPLFVEHQKVNWDADGNEQITNYNVDELAAIARENNHRIEDTDAYTGLIDSHTVPGGVRDPRPPKNLGYVGPFRLGMLGRKHPRFALFADEYHRNDKLKDLADRQRRSVEVLRLKANGRRYIDPIAALAEAPRLPLPVNHYEAITNDDVFVERYSALAPSTTIEVDRYEAFAGGSNTFVTGSTPVRERNASNGKDDMTSIGQADQDSTVRKVLDALTSTREWEALTKLVDMMEDGRLGAEGGPAEPGEAGMPAEMSSPDEAMPPGVEPPMGPPMGDPMMGGPPPGAQPPGPPMMPGDAPAMGPDAGPGMMQGDPLPPDIPEQNAGGAACAERNSPQALTQATGDPEQNIPAAPLIGAAARAAGPALGRLAGRVAGSKIGKEAMKQGAQYLGEEGVKKGIDATMQHLRNKGQEALDARQQRIAREKEAQNKDIIPSAKDVYKKATKGPVGDLFETNSAESPVGVGHANGHHRYSAAEAASPTDSHGETEDMSQVERDQYQAVLAENNKLKKRLDKVEAHRDNILTEQAEHYAALQNKVAVLEADKADSIRRARLEELSNKFPVVDVEAECKAMLYSAGANKSDEEFEQHIATIERYASQAVTESPMIPVGASPYEVDGPGAVESARYAAKEADTAMQIINENIRRGGDRMTYPEALAKAKEQLGNS